MADIGLADNHRIVELAVESPRLKLTTNWGSERQRVWNFFQPVTVIGSGASAHIQVPGEQVCNGHCLIVNTGTELLVCDLHTPIGTLRNSQPLRLAPLCDGDVLRVGPTPMHVAVRRPKVSTAGSQSPSAIHGLEMSTQVRLERTGDGVYPLEFAVAMVGSRLGAEVYLNHPDVGEAHAVIVALGHGAMIVDLGTGMASKLNEEQLNPHQGYTLEPGDRLSVGPYEFVVRFTPHVLAAVQIMKPVAQAAVPLQTRDAEMIESLGPSQPIPSPETHSTIPRTPVDLGSIVNRITALQTAVQTLKHHLTQETRHSGPSQ